MRVEKAIRLAGFLLAGVTLASTGAGFLSDARAAAFYVESGGGVTQIRGGESFFGGTIPSTTGLGGNFNLGVYYGFADARNPVDVQAGLHFRWSTSSTESMFFATHATYANVRIQVSRIFFAAGITPFIWRRVSSSPGIDAFEQVSGTLVFFGEAGLLWPITRDFSLGTALSGQFVSLDSGLSPKPIMDAVVMMRFYFGHSVGGSSGGSAKESNEWQGWRYPLGYQR